MRRLKLFSCEIMFSNILYDAQIAALAADNEALEMGFEIAALNAEKIALEIRLDEARKEVQGLRREMRERMKNERKTRRFVTKHLVLKTRRLEYQNGLLQARLTETRGTVQDLSLQVDRLVPLLPATIPNTPERED